VRDLVLAHHWTLGEIAALTIEQLEWRGQWPVDTAPPRVGRDEARAIIAARKEARTAWVAAVLANEPKVSESVRPVATQGATVVQRLQAQREQANVAKTRKQSIADRALVASASDAALELRNNSGPRREATRKVDAPSISQKSLPAVRDTDSLSELIIQLAGQLDRLERRIQRGAPLGP
jgi:hypothetical protein